MGENNRVISCRDDNISALREKYPDGLRFVVGDTHGRDDTLRRLMEKIGFDPQKDHVYFVGDYNGGGNPHELLKYIAEYYVSDLETPGFHLIRGNHEHELSPVHPLENMPDIIVIKGRAMNYYIVHSGMVASGFDVINDYMAKHPERRSFAFKLHYDCVKYDAPLRQFIWSRNGLYSQTSHWHTWPGEQKLMENRACILHGHAPYCFFKHQDYFSYGSRNIFWENQHVFFSEDLQGFNLDSNIKGRYKNGEGWRGLACLCLNVIDDIAAESSGYLWADKIVGGENAVFSMPYEFNPDVIGSGDITKLLDAKPEYAMIMLDSFGKPYIAE